MIDTETGIEAPPLFLASTDRAAWAARQYIKDQFAAWGIENDPQSGLSADYTSRVVVSELVTNAFRHAGGEAIIVRVSLEKAARPLGKRGYVLIEVWDPSPVQPEALPVDLVGENGRGVAMVASLAEAWGIRPVSDSEGGGKVVWARMCV
ncbi:ATP-binding protein [Actinomadura fulvescens]|uniref:Histidine kinase/HSP90-like ATPase domain-containing protein n=1 Tax=Actinomadura fulvescens TaxID=46160 RepID=A0ABN3PSS6_9ACTN